MRNFLCNGGNLRATKSTRRHFNLCAPHVTRQSVQTTTQPSLSCELLVAKCPLAGLSQLANVLQTPHLDPIPSHWMVIVKDRNGTCTLLDFLPESPTALTTAMALATGQCVPGRLRFHTFPRGDPPFLVHKVSDIGPDALDAAAAFNKTYDTQLQLISNDCGTYVRALVLHLSGVQLDELSGLTMSGRGGRTVQPLPDVLDW